jgi:hypothetical protein
VENTILALEREALERWCHGDPWGFIEISAKDITCVNPDQISPICDLEEFKSYKWKTDGKIHYQGSEFIEPRVVVTRDAAVLTYNYITSIIATEGRIVNQIPWNITDVYFLRNDQWKIVHSHWSYTQHCLPGNLEVPVPIQFATSQYEGILGDLMALESKAMERWRKGDPWGFIEISAPDVTYFDPEMPRRLTGRELLRAEYKKREGKIFYDVIAPRVQSCGNMAVLVYRFLETCLNPDGTIANRIPWNCTEVYVKSNRQWQIMHTHWSFIMGKKK